MQNMIALENQYAAHNYQPLPVVLAKGKGVYVWDINGKRYLDMMSAYSAVSHGHCHPRLVKVLQQQAETLAMVSRAYHTDKLGPFLKRACELMQQERALPMNTGAEAVETAIKAARKWAHTIKGVPQDQAEIIAFEGNFHGRTIAVIGMSTEKQYRYGFGPFTGGMKIVPYGDAQALKQAITPNTAAVLMEPIQGEAGIRLPPEGYLKTCAQICKDENVLFIADEIQTGLGRTGTLLACEHDAVKPDAVILGKALGGGLLPVSMFLASNEIMNVFTPGDHGSTFGGYSLAAAVGLEALNVLIEENLIERSRELGEYLLKTLKEQLKHPGIKSIRGRGLFIGIEVDSKQFNARQLCVELLEQGLLTKDTHETVLRLAPPLIAEKEDLDEAIEILLQVFSKHYESSIP